MTAMDTTCPHCRLPVTVDEAHHYDLITCPKCGKAFQAFSDQTQKLSRAFLDEVLKKKPGSP